LQHVDSIVFIAAGETALQILEGRMNSNVAQERPRQNVD